MAVVAVLGAGSWGTTFAKVLTDAGSSVTLWSRRPEVAATITAKRENADYLPGVLLPAGMRATDDHRVALMGADTVVLALPAQSLRANLTRWVPDLPSGVTVLSLAKGVELRTLDRMSEVIVEVAGVPAERVAVLSGPNLAREIAEEQPTASVIACPDPDRARALQLACTTGYFRPYTNADVVGCELGGAGKNVIALACGMATGMGLGANTTASLITRGLAEITRLGLALGAQAGTFAGLAGLGDLVATCSSPLSRNRSFGEHLGRGDSMAVTVAAAHGQVAEGVQSCTAIRALAARHGVEVPITDGVHRVCHEGRPAAAMARELLGRSTRPE